MSVYDARFLMATRKTDEIEAEPVTVYTHAGMAHLVLDDGTELIFDWDELVEALSKRGDARKAA